MTNLTKRILTALVLLTLAIICGFLGLKYFIFLTHVIVFLLQAELASMFFKGEYKIIRFPFLSACLFATLIYSHYTYYFAPFLFLLIPIMLSLLMVFYSERSNEDIVKQAGLFSLGFLYVGLLPALTIKILQIDNGIFWLLICLAVVFSGDVGAYFVGTRLGRRKLIPQISPNKTWEGALGGIACSLVFSVLAGRYFFPHFSITVLLVSGGLAALLAQSGDFFESLIKRIAGQKDSGNFLPGHGGFLDRFDGILFAIPVYYYLAFY